jgi:hypothetical protein
MGDCLLKHSVAIYIFNGKYLRYPFYNPTFKRILILIFILSNVFFNHEIRYKSFYHCIEKGLRAHQAGTTAKEPNILSKYKAKHSLWGITDYKIMGNILDSDFAAMSNS